MTDSPSPARGPAHPRVLLPLGLLAALLLAGAAICVYLTRFHENALHGDSSLTLANCPEDETTNCEAVNTSEYSEVAGVPISAFGIATYLLLLWLVLSAVKRPQLLSLVFTVGILALAFSACLYYVSIVKIGFLCVWCFRLYCINAAIPVLSGLAAWRSPLRLLGETLGDLRRLSPGLVRSAAIFAALLGMTVLGDLGYRASLARPQPAAAAAMPPPSGVQVPPPVTTAQIPPTQVPPAQVPPSQAAPVSGSPAPVTRPRPGAGTATSPHAAPAVAPAAATSSAAAPAIPAVSVPPGPIVPGAPLVLTVPLKGIQGRDGKLEVTPFDLQARLGKGRPVALLFWAPGFTLSETALVELSRYLHEREPRYEVFAVAGKRDDQRAEMLWERFGMLDLPPGLPLLMDDAFNLSKQLEVTDVPDLVLIDAAGRVVVTKIKGLEQLIALSPERLTGQQVIARVGLGTPTRPITGVPPYYPATELFGRCAPEFTLTDVTSQRSVPFTGRSPNGRPTLLMFWSSTCTHCQKEIPQLVAYVRDHPDALNVVSVSFIKPDRPDGFSHRRITLAYIQSHGIGWSVLDDSSGYANDLYRVVSTPTTFLLSPDGQVLDAWFYTHENLAQVIDATLPRLAAARGQCRPAAPVAPARAAFSVLDPDGRSVPLQSLTDRPSLVHFWATWCEPCRAELPGLLKFRRSLEESGGKVVLVSVEDAAAAERIRAYGTKLDPAFASYRGPTGGLADRLDLGYSVPRTYVVGRGGLVLKTFYGAQSWEDPAFQAKIRALMQITGGRG